MAKATIKFTDADIVAGKYEVDVNVADAHTADGLASAAHVTSMFISQAVATPEFAEGAAAYGRAKGYSLRNDSPVSIIMTLTDIDLDEGSYQMDFEVEGEDVIDGSVTASFLTASFVKDAMGSNEFKAAVMDYAYSLVEGRDDATVNDNRAPAPANPDNKEAA